MRVFETKAGLDAALELAPLMPGAFRFAKQYGPAGFRCVRCGIAKPFPLGALGTGYGITTEHMVERGHVAKAGEMCCYECCGETDRADMIAEGKAVLYLTHDPIRDRSYPFADGKITNWPGTLSIQCRVKRGYHNIARHRYDVWFVGPDDKQWHGVQFGDNTQIARCRRIKS